MAFCIYSEVQLEAGTSLGTITTTDITNLIARSDAEIGDILAQQGISIPSSASQLKTASIALTIAKIKRRQSHELSRPNSTSIGGDISFTASPEAEAEAYELKAKQAIEAYVNYVTGTGIRITRIRTGC